MVKFKFRPFPISVANLATFYHMVLWAVIDSKPKTARKNPTDTICT